MSYKTLNDGVVLSSELRHLGSSIPWFRVSQAPKSKWLANFGRLCVELTLLASVICYLTTLL